MQNAVVSIAPMLQYTDRHFRFLLRLMSQRVLLYTEMLHAGAVCHNSEASVSLLRFHPSEHPVAVQFGGSDPALLGHASGLAALHGYDEINLNVGCPSPKASSGRFGACLMQEPDLV